MKDITLYHFCSERNIEGIKKLGLVLGMCPVLTDTKISFIKNCQWLTTDNNQLNQEWDKGILLDYKRTDYRLSITIPRKHKNYLIKATDFVDKYLPKAAQGFVTEYPGHESWYVYLGNILPQWIKKIEKLGGE